MINWSGPVGQFFSSPKLPLQYLDDEARASNKIESDRLVRIFGDRARDRKKRSQGDSRDDLVYANYLFFSTRQLCTSQLPYRSRAP